ncbi:bifunctional diaminohydroxyphosphoribosylaminopyrimidine deaminase/5-amino-6-(5-phosphoribosylamino)uracil reductase RibD [Rhodococcus sp. IEGM 248]|uniref:bifunctional diaminohydroxyphosphoribosylaminopyrimidine deaminase/5-amino-6-(5-phosphoribosylamino)uracil reductase RibD n=1 Tax=Rhodococcus opacus TaxID=37919 RepID=UPI0013BEFF10|nr:bifunctional diaminohydroxyphosphoribosylaminopyrimidine deaminase/5-amino-6-(5-phosphoribosylamino)uracil reductase RibD [Rhodococcus opacus]MDV7084153.1 bifunctional diaminohydroxyphosphoribosylaminopyrimidine deaminase/5-amino-6-(5-phosphoribosylamino)uracil reductase RibD [Rhodococcus opacus]NDV07193.1 bifunctional diaminohydroxyphosphoribosylaminopyrimidine deaminase/5-amino-6-(5-phosphoribosylamino)uracil reductase RibD [Rhodococcus sp. IEGM 248]
MRHENSAADLDAAMQIAIGAAESARGFTSPNPAVGAVVLDAAGRIAGVGMTQPPGGPHAEVVALREAGDAARGGTAVVTLEPCNHHGRTGPCSQALLDAGVVAVHYAVGDPNPEAAGGAETLVSAGVEVTSGLRAQDVERGPLRSWLHRQRTGRPHVTWKYAATLDGRSAAADGTSQWITGPEARERVHADRAKLDAIVVGTGTVLADDPRLTARMPDGSLAAHQPVRVVVGLGDIPADARVLDDSAPTLLLRTRDVDEVLAALAEYTDVLLEGGPRLAGAFLAAGRVDRIQAYLAPLVLGAGRSAVADAGVHTIDGALRFRHESVETIGPDLLLSLVPAVSENPDSPQT